MNDRCPTCNRPYKRSNAQNNFLWGVAYKIICDHTGHDSEEIHSYCKARFLPRHYVIVNGLEVLVEKSTASLTTAEFSEYLDKVCAFASRDLGLEIPYRYEEPLI